MLAEIRLSKVSSIMRKLWLNVNSRSGSFDPDLPERLALIASHSGWSLDRVIDVAESELPTPSDLRAADVEWIANHTGDGTLNSLARGLEGWDGAVLALPGGTMNFVARNLHGETLGSDKIVRRALSEPVTLQKLPIVNLNDLVSFCGVIAGPTASWSDVREALRERDLAAVVEHSQNALRETLHGERPEVVDGDNELIEDDTPSLFVEPYSDGLHVTSFEAQTLGDLAKHGVAWLMKDFRNGPHEDLGIKQCVEVRAPRHGVSLLVDGERVEGGPEVRMTAGVFDLDFVATKA